MQTAYYSTVLDQPVETVWSLIRDFNNYPVYIEGVTESFIEDGKRGDEVGAVRRFCYGGNWLRQRLGAHSDEQRSLTYIGIDRFAFPDGFLERPPSPIRYEGTIHLLPITDRERAFIEWSVTFEAAPVEAEIWRDLLLKLIPDWTGSLRRTLLWRAVKEQ